MTNSPFLQVPAKSPHKAAGSTISREQSSQSSSSSVAAAFGLQRGEEKNGPPKSTTGGKGPSSSSSFARDVGEVESHVSACMCLFLPIIS